LEFQRGRACVVNTRSPSIQAAHEQIVIRVTGRDLGSVRAEEGEGRTVSEECGRLLGHPIRDMGVSRVEANPQQAARPRRNRSLEWKRSTFWMAQTERRDWELGGPVHRDQRSPTGSELEEIRDSLRRHASCIGRPASILPPSIEHLLVGRVRAGG